MVYTSHPHWVFDQVSRIYTHRSGVHMNERIVLDYGFPPIHITDPVLIQTWYFNQATLYKNPYDRFFGQGLQSTTIELLLSVASYTAHIPASVIYTVSLEWLRCRTTKDSDWRSCSLVKSPQHIKLWEKDFILTQITPHGFGLIKEVKIGCKLNSPAPFPRNGAFRVLSEVLEAEDVQFFNISEMR
jgi:hypothetical protein